MGHFTHTPMFSYGPTLILSLSVEFAANRDAVP